MDGSSVLIASGELDLVAAPIVRESIATLEGRVILDLSEVTFLDSTTIGVLVGQRNRLVKDGGDLVVRGPANLVRRTLEIVGLSDWIE